MEAEFIPLVSLFKSQGFKNGVLNVEILNSKCKN